MLTTRICPECKLEFQTDNPRKEFCSLEHSKIGRVRRFRAKHRKKGGPNGGPRGGGPTLFDSIDTVDAGATFVPHDRTGILSTSRDPRGPGEERKPSQSVTKSRKDRAFHAAA